MSLLSQKNTDTQFVGCGQLLSTSFNLSSGFISSACPSTMDHWQPKKKKRKKSDCLRCSGGVKKPHSSHQDTFTSTQMLFRLNVTLLFLLIIMLLILPPGVKLWPPKLAPLLLGHYSSLNLPLQHDPIPIPEVRRRLRGCVGWSKKNNCRKVFSFLIVNLISCCQRWSIFGGRRSCCFILDSWWPGCSARGPR